LISKKKKKEERKANTECSSLAAAIDPVEPDNVLKALESYPDYTLSM
jgi:hypothetical protein